MLFSTSQRRIPLRKNLPRLSTPLPPGEGGATAPGEGRASQPKVYFRNGSVPASHVGQPRDPMFRGRVALFRGACLIVPRCRLTVPRCPPHCSGVPAPLFRGACLIAPRRRRTVPRCLSRCSEAPVSWFRGACLMVPRCPDHCSEIPGSVFRGARITVPSCPDHCSEIPVSLFRDAVQTVPPSCLIVPGRVPEVRAVRRVVPNRASPIAKITSTRRPAWYGRSPPSIAGLVLRRQQTRSHFSLSPK